MVQTSAKYIDYPEAYCSETCANINPQLFHFVFNVQKSCLSIMEK